MTNIPQFPDQLLAEAYEQAAERNVLKAIYSEVFFGFVSVCVEADGYGLGNTFPGLDGHQLTDALLWLGQVEIVKANWEYVRPFQRADGLIPFAILPGTREMMRVPGHPPALVDPSGAAYKHWVPGDPFRTLGCTSHIMTADVIYRHTLDQGWLADNIDSVNGAADFLAKLTSREGLVAGAGYYHERPTRIEYDGVAQCYTAESFRRVAALNRVLGNEQVAERYDELAHRIINHFQKKFWLGERFAEYIHPERGLISHHGFSDTDWAALAMRMATNEQVAVLWPQLKNEQRFYYQGMPTGIVTEPEKYEDWETTYPDWKDLAAMGRVWYLEAWARARMGDGEGLVDTLRRVAEEGRRHDYYWGERYFPECVGEMAQAEKYCEYPANLIRIVQEFLLGVEFGLDGSLSLAPVVPDSWWETGFGQQLDWCDQSLFYRLSNDKVVGEFHGASSLPISICLPDGRKIDFSLTKTGRFEMAWPALHK